MQFHEIKRVTTQSQLDAVCKFRYEVYINELGDVYDEKYASNQMIKDELDEFGITLFVEKDGKIIGTGRSNLGKHGEFEQYWIDCYDLDLFPDRSRISLSSKMMVAPEYRATGLSISILSEFISIFKTEGVYFNFIDCIPTLVPLYESLGYRRYKDNAPEDKNFKYYVPLVVCLEDIEYYKKIRHPYYEMLLGHPNDQKVANWFNEKFKPQIGLTKESLIDHEALLECFTNKIDRNTVKPFNSLNDQALVFLLSTGTILNCKKGETICYKTDSDSSLYILLKGSVSIGQNESDISFLEIGPGEFFGEVNYVHRKRRQYDARALSNCQVLVIHHSVVKSAPAQYANLFKILNQHILELIQKRQNIYSK